MYFRNFDSIYDLPEHSSNYPRPWEYMFSNKSIDTFGHLIWSVKLSIALWAKINSKGKCTQQRFELLQTAW